MYPHKLISTIIWFHLRNKWIFDPSCFFYIYWSSSSTGSTTILPINSTRSTCCTFVSKSNIIICSNSYIIPEITRSRIIEHIGTRIICSKSEISSCSNTNSFSVICSKCKVLSIIGSNIIQSSICTSISIYWPWIQAVSYTHLDVYKRQYMYLVLHRVQNYQQK